MLGSWGVEKAGVVVCIVILRMLGEFGFASEFLAENIFPANRAFDGKGIRSNAYDGTILCVDRSGVPEPGASDVVTVEPWKPRCGVELRPRYFGERVEVYSIDDQ